MARASKMGALVLCLGAAATAGSVFDGRYALDKSRSANVEKAIGEATESMNFVTRPIARSRLGKTNQTSAGVSIAVTDRIEVDFGTKPISAPLDGAAVPWTRPDGETFQVRAGIDPDKLVETFQGKDGSRRNTFSLLDGGKSLAMDVQVDSPRLPKPVRYRLVYARVP